MILKCLRPVESQTSLNNTNTVKVADTFNMTFYSEIFNVMIFLCVYVLEKHTILCREQYFNLWRNSVMSLYSYMLCVPAIVSTLSKVNILDKKVIQRIFVSLLREKFILLRNFFYGCNFANPVKYGVMAACGWSLATRQLFHISGQHVGRLELGTLSWYASHASH